ncbi:xanthine dehydrogenase/oxidase-like [Mya arenaria]|uniref:xanthine dehydrogenase/oxidase-like n=1 Tax=Mya arenaria TaxID=6604 RepID=UPI0022E41B48|nr:xanthine dehydrogenase/oxidase-like [Mya arenaria]
MHVALDSCLFPVCAAHGKSVVTVEGVGNTDTGLHAVQRRLLENHGLQCGFCTPGFVMSAFTLLRNHPAPSRRQVERSIEGNLCRCTGYRPIIEAFSSFSPEVCPMGSQCCRNRDRLEKTPSVDKKLIAENEDQVPIFPPELQVSDAYRSGQAVFGSGEITWYRPVSLRQLLQLRDTFPSALLVMGNTTTGFAIKKHEFDGPLIYGGDVTELKRCDVTDVGITVGGGCTMNELEEQLPVLEAKVKEEWKRRHINVFNEMLSRYAVQQIRNCATVGGSLCCGRNDSDISTLLHTLPTVVTIASLSGERTVPIQNMKLGKGEIITKVLIPHSEKREYSWYWKVAGRRSFSLAIVNGAASATIGTDNTVTRLRISFGGIAKGKVYSTDLTSFNKKKWNDDLLHGVLGRLTAALESVNGQQEDKYREAVASAFWFKFYAKVTTELQLSTANDYQSLLTPLYREGYHSRQTHEQPTSTDAVGRETRVKHGDVAVSGQAMYADDVPAEKGELSVALVLSTKARAKILNVDTSGALMMEGVRAYLDHRDLAAPGTHGTIIKDQPIFAIGEVLFWGQPIGAVVAETRELAVRAAAKVSVLYEDLEPILTIQEAIEKESYFGPPMEMVEGDVEAALAKSDVVFQGEYATGLQDHMYIEPHAAVARLREGGEMEVTVTGQSIRHDQEAIAELLGIPNHKTTVRVKRLGGGFGGKESISPAVSVITALAAKKTGKSARLVLPREVDMAFKGKRHPMLGVYKVGVSNDGILEAIDVKLYSNAGYAVDLSWPILENAVTSFESGYKVRALRVVGRACKTHTASNTAFRGFGHPQGVLVMEDIVTRAAAVTGLTPEVIRERNLYKDGDMAPCGTLMKNVTLPLLWRECKQGSHYEQRLKDVEDFNKQNRWKKRGIAMTATKYAVGFGLPTYNQGAALVNIYLDGTVLVEHGGIEMGQGLNTKCIQVASRTLGLPEEKIYTWESSTREIPNAIVTAGSMGFDLYGPAVKIACETLIERLKPVREAMPDDPWEKQVKAAFQQRVPMSATGYNRPPDKDHFSMAKKNGNKQDYFTYGAVCTEVEIDVLTGENQVVRTDIFVDLGSSVNPAVDIGQIEGAYVMGLGMVTSEDMRVNAEGQNMHCSPLLYKIPSVTSVPRSFNVTLVKNPYDIKTNIYSSKSVGEPPLILSMSVITAIKHAVGAARAQQGQEGYFRMDSPATVQRIAELCGEQIHTKK